MAPSKSAETQLSSGGCKAWPGQFTLPAVAAATAVGSLGLAIEPSAEAQTSVFSGPYEITTPPPSGNWATLTDPADISSFSTEVPESDSLAWLAAAVTGPLLHRELRRRAVKLPG